MKLQLRTKGIHCQSCELLLKDALQELPGVKTLEISHKSGLVHIEFDESKVTKKKIIEVIQKEGYKIE